MSTIVNLQEERNDLVMKKGIKRLLVMVCVAMLFVSSISVSAADVEPRANYSRCVSCGQLGYGLSRTEKVDEMVAYIHCSDCNEIVTVDCYTLVRYYRCNNCGFSDTSNAYMSVKRCGHN